MARAATPTAIPGWRGPAYRVDSGFPVVAVVGVWQPELFVATHVADACTHGEIAIVAAHEHAHVAARDNLMRAAFAATPFVGSAGNWLERAWAAAAEEAADLTARKGGSGVMLAAALVKVARLATPVEPRPALGSALIGAGTLEGRLRRLLDPPPQMGRAAWWVGVAATAALAAASSPVLRQVYDAAEFVVAFGR